MTTMFALNKSRLVLIATVGTLAYASQFYKLSGWQQLRLEPIAAVESSQGSPPTPNTSIGEHLFPTTQPAAESSVAKDVSAISPKLVSLGTSQRVSPKLPTIRIASFNLESFGESKLNKAPVLDVIAMLLRPFDVVALQDIASRQQDILPRLVDKLNQSGRHFDFCIGPRVGDGGNLQQFAFLFDTDTIETDRYQLYTLSDPQNLMTYDPLVGWFRTTCVPANEAFTFSLVNVRMDPSRGAQEQQLISDLIRSVRKDGRSEDDILVAGDFGSSDHSLSAMRNLGMIFAIEGLATNVLGDRSLDNIIMQSKATDEFDGRSGVVDFLRQFNLTIDQAMQVSSHLPVWAEFIAIEGGTPGLTHAGSSR